MASTYPVHPAANLMPRLSDAGIAALAADIKANGQHEPVVLFEGQVLDGRHRLAACELAGVEPTFRTLATCPDPMAFVLSINVRRRHLSTSQLAMVAGRVAISLESSGTNLYRRSREAAAEMVGGVESQSVAAAIATLKTGIPALVAMVDGDELAVSVAAKAAKFPQDRQRELVAKGPEAVREAVKSEVKPRETKAKPTATASETPAATTTTATTATEAAPVTRSPGHSTRHPLLDELDAATDLATLDRAYSKVAVANLSGDAAEEAGRIYQRRGAELRAQAAATVAPTPAAPPSQPAPVSAPAPAQPRQADLFADAPVPVSTQAPTPQPEKAAVVETVPADTVTIPRAEYEAMKAELTAYRAWVAVVEQRSVALAPTIKGAANLERIRRLIELAGSPSENEARNAAALACRMIREQGVKMLTSDPSILDDINATNRLLLETARKMGIEL